MSGDKIKKPGRCPGFQLLLVLYQLKIRGGNTIQSDRRLWNRYVPICFCMMQR